MTDSQPDTPWTDDVPAAPPPARTTAGEAQLAAALAAAEGARGRADFDATFRPGPTPAPAERQIGVKH